MKRIESIENTTGCKICVSHKSDAFGYPRVFFNGANTPMHRFIWIKEKGDIPKGMVIRHKCDNPKCINIEHLEIGTPQDNVADRHSRGRTSRVPRTCGEINGMAKLNVEKVSKIRALLNSGEFTQTKIAKIFGVTQFAISSIARNKSWKNLGVGY